MALNADGTLSGAKHYVADAGVADIFIAVANEGGAPVLAIVERDALSEGAIAQNTLIDLTKRAANVDFSGVVPAEVIRGESIASALRTRCCWVRCLRRLKRLGAIVPQHH